MDTQQKIDREISIYTYWSTRSRVGRYDVPEDGLPLLRQKIERFNRKADRLSGKPIAMIVLGSYFVTEKILGHEHVKKLVRVLVEGEAPRINGWEFCAVIQHQATDGVGGNIIRAIPGSTPIPDMYRTAERNCDHCHQQRYRRDTYILCKGGEFKQVGSGCLADFTGGNDPQHVASLAEWYVEFFSDVHAIEEMDTHNPYFHVESFLAHVVACVRVNGWTSGSEAWDNPGKESTARQALANLGDHVNPIEVTADDRDLARRALAWVKGTLSNRERLNDYEWNLVSACSQGDVPIMSTREAGIVASSIMAYRKDMQIEIEREKPSNEWFGEVGNRIDLSGLTCTYTRELDDPRWVRVMYKFVDDAGHRFVWFGGGGTGVHEGWTYNGKATIKSHDEYKGLKQTVLTRCKFDAVRNGAGEPVQ